MQAKGITVVITGIQEQPLDMLKRVDLVPDLIPEHHIFPDFPSAIQQLERGLEELDKAHRTVAKIDFGDMMKWINWIAEVGSNQFAVVSG